MRSISKAWEDNKHNEWQISLRVYRSRWFFGLGLFWVNSERQTSLDIGVLCFQFHVSRFKGWTPYSTSVGHIS